ncbi:MAG: hypothetical protein B7Y99_00230 [Caulobacterales bacterium 32-69-10]|nr:MAG: hypothetical protein B7Y99_00230 [Caulobacterales bacterium 32-69-10]
MTKAMLALVALLVSATPLAAHGELSVTGKVTQVSVENLTIKTAEGRNVTVPLTDATIYIGQAKSERSQLKAGQDVEIVAFGDRIEDASQTDITILSTSPARKAGS